VEVKKWYDQSMVRMFLSAGNTWFLHLLTRSSVTKIIAGVMCICLLVVMRRPVGLTLGELVRQL